MEKINSVDTRTEKLLKHISTVKVDELNAFTEDVFNEYEKVTNTEMSVRSNLRKEDRKVSKN